MVHQPQIEIAKFTLARGKGAVKANVWVLFDGVLELMFKVLSARTLFVVGPSGEYLDRGGNKRWIRRTRFRDTDLEQRVIDLVLTEYDARRKRGEQPPPTITPKTNPVNQTLDQILAEAGEYLPADIAERMAQAMIQVIDNPEASPRERTAAVKAITKALGA